VGVDIPAEAPIARQPPDQYSLLQRLTAFFVRLFERYTPDPYILAVVLSILTAVLAALLAPKRSITTIFTGWYNGLFSISAFAFQVLLILVTGYALSTSKPIRALLGRVAAFGTTPKKAIVLTIVVVYVASFLNWGFGLVVAGLLAREVAQRIRIDFGWLVGGAYSGWMIFSSGFSSSIALSLATPGSSLNSLLIGLFVPSAGGHWAVQGPFAVPAAVGLHASQAATAMGVAYGEQVADMIQPFWALPVVAVAGISIRRVMGFTVMSFLVGMVLFGAALLLLV
jgi:short subunit fatty acids transporter